MVGTILGRMKRERLGLVELRLLWNDHRMYSICFCVDGYVKFWVGYFLGITHVLFKYVLCVC